MSTPILRRQGKRGVSHQLVFTVREGLGGCDRDRVARVDAHHVEVLDRADDDGVVGQVAHHLHLEFFPSQNTLLDQHFVHWRQLEPAAQQRMHLF